MTLLALAAAALTLGSQGPVTQPKEHFQEITLAVQGMT